MSNSMMDNDENLTVEELRMFNGSRTTIDDIKAAGWHVDHSSGGNWYWRHKATGRIFMPFWVLMVQLEAEQLGASRVRGMMLEALGIKP